MIDRYSDQAANERTFLAWLRTGIRGAHHPNGCDRDAPFPS
jgi:Domain of unknown function (DUF202)